MTKLRFLENLPANIQQKVEVHDSPGFTDANMGEWFKLTNI